MIRRDACDESARIEASALADEELSGSFAKISRPSPCEIWF